MHQCLNTVMFLGRRFVTTVSFRCIPHGKVLGLSWSKAIDVQLRGIRAPMQSIDADTTPKAVQTERSLLLIQISQVMI